MNEENCSLFRKSLLLKMASKEYRYAVLCNGKPALDMNLGFKNHVFSKFEDAEEYVKLWLGYSIEPLICNYTYEFPEDIFIEIKRIEYRPYVHPKMLDF